MYIDAQQALILQRSGGLENSKKLAAHSCAANEDYTVGKKWREVDIQFMYINRRSESNTTG